MKHARTRKHRSGLSEYRKADIAVAITAVLILTLVIGGGYAMRSLGVIP